MRLRIDAGQRERCSGTGPRVVLHQRACCHLLTSCCEAALILNLCQKVDFDKNSQKPFKFLDESLEKVICSNFMDDLSWINSTCDLRALLTNPLAIPHSFILSFGMLECWTLWLWSPPTLNQAFRSWTNRPARRRPGPWHPVSPRLGGWPRAARGRQTTRRIGGFPGESAATDPPGSAQRRGLAKSVWQAGGRIVHVLVYNLYHHQLEPLKDHHN